MGRTYDILEKVPDVTLLFVDRAARGCEVVLKARAAAS
jgi:hypothetical protein